MNLYKESYVSKLKPGQAQRVQSELKSRSEEELAKKNSRSKSKTVTYNLDNDNSTADEAENELVEAKMINVGRPTNINPGILRKTDHDGSKMKKRSESQDLLPRSESKEMAYPAESGVSKGFSLKVDFEQELEKVRTRV